MKYLKIILVILLSAILSTSAVLYLRYDHYKDGLPVLGYHNVLKDDIKNKYYKNNIYVMSESTFEKEMKYLHDNNYHTLTMDEVYAYYNGDYILQDKDVVLTFDDGFESFNEVVKPILEKYDLHATCFVIGSKLEKENSNDVSKYQYLRKDELINTKNVEYYSHTYDLHHSVNTYQKLMQIASYETIYDDFIKNNQYVDSSYFAFPYGRSSINARQVLSDLHIKIAFGYGQNRNMVREDYKYDLPRYLMFDSMPLTLFEFIVS